MISRSGRRLQAIAELRPWVERARTFSGWTFDELRVRDLEPAQPWDYDAIAREYAASARVVIDFGTGGGEVYAGIVGATGALTPNPSPKGGEGGQPRRWVATEEWDVNATVARDRLAPMGVDVVRGQSERPGFRDGAFDLVLSRHEAIDPAEVARVLRPGGVFVTQQVGREEWEELRQVFPRQARWPDHYIEYARGLEAAGCEIMRREHHAWRSAYPTIGEIAFMLLVSPWEIEGFDPVAEVDALLALEDAYGSDDGIVLTQARYLLVARKL